MNIHVNNLAPNVTKEDLRETFEPFGLVTSITVSKEKHKNRLSLSGFVEMPDSATAQRAINALKGKNLKGKPLQFAHSKSRHDGRKGGGSRRSAGDKVGGTRGGGF